MVWIVLCIALWVSTILLLMNSHSRWVKDHCGYISYWDYVVHETNKSNFFGGWGLVVSIVVSVIVVCAIYAMQVSNDVEYEKYAQLYGTYTGLLNTTTDVVNESLYTAVIEYNKTVTLRRAEQQNWEMWAYYSPGRNWNNIPLIEGRIEALKPTG